MNKQNRPKTTIAIYVDTKNKLAKLKVIPREPYDAVIMRLLSE